MRERVVTSGGPLGRFPGEVRQGDQAFTLMGGAYVYQRTNRTVDLPDEETAEALFEALAARKITGEAARQHVLRHAPRARYTVFQYDPAVSPGHAAIVRADAEAVQEVADQRGVPVGLVLEEARAARAAANGGEHPADVLLAEAERTGVDPEVLIRAHAEKQAEGIVTP